MPRHAADQDAPTPVLSVTLPGDSRPSAVIYGTRGQLEQVARALTA